MVISFVDLGILSGREETSTTGREFQVIADLYNFPSSLDKEMH
jgi:hypothetical protein